MERKWNPGIINPGLCYASSRLRSLPSVWAEVESLKPLQEDNPRQQALIKGNKRIRSDYRWVTKMDYHGHSIHWLECLETLSEEGKEKRKARLS